MPPPPWVSAGTIDLHTRFNFTYNVAYCAVNLAAKSEADHYARELKREQEEIIAVPETGLISTISLSVIKNWFPEI